MRDLQYELECVREYIIRMTELNDKHSQMIYTKRALHPVISYTAKKKINVIMGMMIAWVGFVGSYTMKEMSALIRVRGFSALNTEMKSVLWNCAEIGCYVFLLVCIPVGIVLHIANRDKEYRNKEAEKRQASIREENSRTMELNRKNNQQIEITILEKKEVYRNYKEGCAAWFPPEYCYMEAVDFFIQLVVKDNVDNMEEAIRRYKAYLKNEQAYPINSTKTLTEKEELVRRQLQGRNLEQIVIDKNYMNYYNEKLFRDGIEGLNTSLDSIWKSGYAQ